METIGIEVILTFPPVTNDYYNLNRTKIESYYVSLLANNLNLISTPSDFVFETEMFFDTGYHMTENGGKLRTIRLNEDVSEYQTQKILGAPRCQQ